MSDQTITAISGIIAAAVAAIGGGWWGRRKGVADAAEGQARAEVTLSGEARALALDLRTELAMERTERHRLEAVVDKLKDDLAAERRRALGLEDRVAELERAMRRAGIALPGDTPSAGTPAAGGMGTGGAT